MVYPMQYGRMPMPSPYAYRGYGGYGGYGGGQNRNNTNALVKYMLLKRMMDNNAAQQQQQQEMQQQQQQYAYAGGQYPSYGGGGGHHHHRGSVPRGYGRPSRRAMSKAVPKKTAKKKKEDDDDDNTEEVTSTSTSTSKTPEIYKWTGEIPGAGKTSEAKIFLNMKKLSLNEQQFRNFIAENAIRVVKRFITEAYSNDDDSNLLLDDDEDVTNDDMVTPQENKDLYTLDVFNVEADEGIDDMKYAGAAYETFDDALEAARECARSYADCGEVVEVSIMSGEFETPSGDIFGDPEVIYTISNSDKETTMNARHEAGFATPEVDEYTE